MMASFFQDCHPSVEQKEQGCSNCPLCSKSAGTEEMVEITCNEVERKTESALMRNEFQKIAEHLKAKCAALDDTLRETRNTKDERRRQMDEQLANIGSHRTTMHEKLTSVYQKIKRLKSELVSMQQVDENALNEEITVLLDIQEKMTKARTVAEHAISNTPDGNLSDAMNGMKSLMDEPPPISQHILKRLKVHCPPDMAEKAAWANGMQGSLAEMAINHRYLPVPMENRDFTNYDTDLAGTCQLISGDHSFLLECWIHLGHLTLIDGAGQRKIIDGTNVGDDTWYTGICVHPDNTMVYACTVRHIYMYSVSESAKFQLLRKVKVSGSKLLHGIAISSTSGHLALVDSWMSRVTIHNPDGALLNSIEPDIDGTRVLSYPEQVAWDPDLQQLYVFDHKSVVCLKGLSIDISVNWSTQVDTHHSDGCCVLLSVINSSYVLSRRARKVTKLIYWLKHRSGKKVHVLDAETGAMKETLNCPMAVVTGMYKDRSGDMTMVSYDWNPDGPIHL